MKTSVGYTTSKTIFVKLISNRGDGFSCMGWYINCEK